MPRVADNLLLQMETQVQEIIVCSRTLLELFQWADQISSGSHNNFSPVAKRLAGFFFGFALALDLSHSESRARVLAQAKALFYSLNLSEDLDFEIDVAHLRSLDQSYNIENEIDGTHPIDIDQFRRLEKIKIYKNVNFSVLIFKLEKLKSEKPFFGKSITLKTEFIEEYIQTWCDEVYIDRELLMLTKTELQILEDYLYVNWLIIQCKNSALRISPQVWQKIEDMMLIPPRLDI